MDKNSLLYFIGDYLPPELQEKIARGTVRDIKFDSEKQTAEIKADFEKYIGKQDILDISSAVKDALSIRKVVIEGYYPAGEFGDSCFETISAALKEAIPAANGFLDSAVCEIKDGRLIINVENGAPVLEGCGAGDFIASYIAEHFALKYDVSFYGVSEITADSPEYAEMQKPDFDPEALLAQKSAKKYKKVKRTYAEIPLSLDGSEVLFGKPVKSKPVPIKDVNAGDGFVTVWGEVFGLDIRDTKDGTKKIIKFNITDKTNSFAVRKIEKNENVEALTENLKDGKTVLINGRVVYDDYSKAYCINPSSVIAVAREESTDDAPEKRVELHLHTKMSMMDGVTSVKDLVKRAAAWGHKAVAITDHGVVQAFPDAAAAAEETGIKIIYGMEGYFVDDSVTAVTGNAKMPFDGTFVIFDVETTGLRTGFDRLIEIGAVKFEDGVEVSSYQTFVDPGRKIPGNIIKLTGINDDMVRGAPGEKDAVLSFFEWAGKDAVLVAHNASFDTDFLKSVCERNDIPYGYTHIDTLILSQELVENIKNFRLDTVAKALHLPDFDHHRADEDARILSLIFKKLIDKLKSRGINSVEEINGVVKPDPCKLKSYHIILLAKNTKGLKNLYQMISDSNLKYYGGNTRNKKPQIPLSVLMQHREGIIVGSACEAGQLYQAVLAGKPRETLLRYAKLYDYLEIQPNGNNAFLINEGTLESEEDLNDLNRRIIELADEIGVPVVATGDVHFLDPEDEIYREIIMHAQGFSDSDRQAPLYLRTTESMLNEFAWLGEEKAREVVIENTNKIADMCEEIKPIPDGKYPPYIEGSDTDLRRICNERMKKLYGDPLPEYIRERLDKELNTIIENGYAVLYMIAQKLVKNSEEHGYYVGSRGSVGSSFAAFAAGISEVNPLAPHYLCPKCCHSEFFLKGEYGSGFDMPPKNCPECGGPMLRDGHDIPFETFLGFKGEKSPDIDLNFSSEYQFYAHRYTEELFGKSHVFKAGTISTVASKTAYGYVNKWIEESLDSLDRLREERQQQGLDLNEEERKKREYLMNISPAEIDRLTLGCTGVKRTTGQHPGGMVVVPADKDAEDFTPIQHPADDPTSIHRTTHFDFHSLHDTILKLDNLGHEVPTMYKHLEDLTGTSVMDADICDPKLYQLLATPEPLGVTAEDIDCPTGTLSLPELGTPFVLGMLVDAKPKNFSDMLQISGLSHGTDVWLGNAQELIRQGICTISDVIGTRDSIMVYLIHKGLDKGMAFDIMEIVRKGAATKKLTDEHKQAMLDNGVPQWYLDSCLKIKYMFPKAHAAAYVIAAMRLAWYKLYYPIEYYATYLTVRGGDLEMDTVLAGRARVKQRMEELNAKIKAKEESAKDADVFTSLQVINEMMARGVQVLPVDIYKSTGTKYIVEDGKIRLPFAAIPGCGGAAAEGLENAKYRRKKVLKDDGSVTEEITDEIEEFISIEDFRQRSKASQTVIDALEEGGAFESLPKTTQLSFF
ncbi:MAG: PolC-type DNA polymerase III [Clostridia bacterium]|nr:PolC-type DNA polymerase III [Clostridia bacterium]